jgi:hypothetical protein
MKLFNRKKYEADKREFQNPFRRVEVSTGLHSWVGVLPQTPLCTHFLHCYNLQNELWDDNTPEKRFPTATHEIKIGYRLELGSRPLSIIYTAQYNFESKFKTAEWIADRVSLSISLHLRDARTAKRVLLKADPEYWDWYINHEYKCFAECYQ